MLLRICMDNNNNSIYPSQDYISMLIEEAEKVYNKLTKELVDESVSDYDCSTSSSLRCYSQLIRSTTTIKAHPPKLSETK